MKILILTTGNHMYGNILIDEVIKKRKTDVIGVISLTTPIGNKTLIQSVIKIINTCGVKYFLYKSFETLGFNLMTLLPRRKRKLFSLKEITNNIPIYKTNNINSEKTINLIKKLNPDMVISCYFNQIIKEEILNSFKQIINIHGGLLPDHKGISPYLHVLSKGGDEVGFTIHFIERGIDTGGIISKKQIKINNKDTVHTTYLKLTREAAGELGRLLSQEKIISTKQENKGEYFSWPTKKTIRDLKKYNRKLIKISDFINSFFLS